MKKVGILLVLLSGAAVLALTACGSSAGTAAASADASAAVSASGSAPGSASAPEGGVQPLAVLRVEQGKVLNGEIAALVRDGVLHSVQEDGENRALAAPAQTAYCFSAAGTARTVRGTCAGCTVRYEGSVGCNAAYAEFSLEGTSLPDGVYVGLGGDVLPLPAGWDGGGGSGWSADLNGDGRAETCAFTHAGDDWTMLLDGVEKANFPLDGIYTAAYAAVPMDADGDGRYEVVLALMGHNTSVWVWSAAGELLATYYTGD